MLPCGECGASTSVYTLCEATFARQILCQPERGVGRHGAKTDAVVLGPRRWTWRRAELAPGKEIRLHVRADDRGGSLIVINLARAYEVDPRSGVARVDIIHITVSGYNRGIGRGVQRIRALSRVADLPRRGRRNRTGAILGRWQRAASQGHRGTTPTALILSERAASEWRAAPGAVAVELREGDVRTGTVSNLCDFGAFVDLGGIDGLVHISELAWEHVNHPRDVLEVGQEVSVEVLRVDQERQRIGLSLKRTQPDPWQSIATRYSAGQVIEGVVTHLAKFGAFVELEPGIEGLVHVSELAEGNVEDPAQIVSEGDRLTVLILEVDANQRRIAQPGRRPFRSANPPARPRWRARNRKGQGCPPRQRLGTKTRASFVVHRSAVL